MTAREELESLAREELARHGLDGWRVGWNRRVTALGVCRYTDRRILLSEPLAARNTRETMLDVIRHEVAHALAGPAAKHGPQWRAACRVTGARPRSCADASTVETVPAPWRVVCPRCGVIGTRHKRRAGTMRHAYCGEVITYQRAA